jgi:cell division protease FtsH
VFLGREITEQRDYSEKVAQEIDDEVQNIILEAYATAKRALIEHYAKLVQIARHLMQNETVEGDELQKLFESEAPPLEYAVPSSA